MRTKEEVQKEIIAQIVESDFKGIVLSSVRSGKTRILITSIKEHCTKENPKVLVCYPNIDIKKSWMDECEKIGCPMDITYSTFMSLEKVMNEDWDYVVFDEAHLIPEEHKLPMAGKMAREFCHVVFASGTYNQTTLIELMIHTALPLIVEYTTEQAIADGLISDYTVFIHLYELDPVNLRTFISGKRKWSSTDVKELARLTKQVETTYGERKMFAALARMRFINTNDSLLSVVRKWLALNHNKRVLMFVENEKFGLKFKLPMFNSKSKDDSVLKQFLTGQINQLCLIKKGSAGVTYPYLDNILITAINSNGEHLEQMLGRSLLNDTEHSDVHIFVTENQFQLNWLGFALANIPDDKIIWIKSASILAKTK